MWGFSLPGGSSRLRAAQTFGPDVCNMRNQFSGNSAAKPATFGREAGSLPAPGALWILEVGGKASLAVQPDNEERGQG